MNFKNTNPRQRENGRNHGEVFTNMDVIHYLLDEVGYRSSDNLEFIRILEPAAGTGAFAIEIMRRLYESSVLHGFSFIEAIEANVRFIELNENNYLKLKRNISNFFKKIDIDSNIEELGIISKGDFLTTKFAAKFNCIVGNPPYIRHELIPDENKEIYKERYQTFKYRVDLYVLFFEYSLKLLEKKGCLSFICSNRWLYNQYGELLREKIAKYYFLSKIVNIENTSPFDESVIAYPSITTVVNKKSRDKTLYFETNAKQVDLNIIHFERISPPSTSSWQNLFLTYDINHKALVGIEEQNFKLGIGVATGADKVFIRRESEIKEIEKSRLLPLITSRDLVGTQIVCDKYLLNPYDEGQLCDLNEYPLLRNYFLQHKSVLQNRYIAKKNPNNWYRTIDKIDPTLLAKPKLLLPDLAASKYLHIDKGDYYPHHNLYYITGEDYNSLVYLACILMSDFIKDQLSQIGIRMNGGVPRFQIQTLKKLRIPDLIFLDSLTKRSLIKAYDNHDLSQINIIVNEYCTYHDIKCKQGA